MAMQCLITLMRIMSIRRLAGPNPAELDSGLTQDKGRDVARDRARVRALFFDAASARPRRASAYERVNMYALPHVHHNTAAQLHCSNASLVRWPRDAS